MTSPIIDNKRIRSLVGVGLLGAFLGFTVATAILFPLIQNAQGKGRSMGFREGTNHVVGFLQHYLKSKPDEKEKLLPDSLIVSGSRLSLVEVNGVVTVRVDPE